MNLSDMDRRRGELNAIVAFVDRPRRLGAVVAHVDRPLQTVRSQLIALVAAGRLTHPEHGFFAPAGFEEMVVRQPKEHRASCKGTSLANQVLALVDAPMMVRDLAVKIDRPVQTLHRLLNRLIDQGYLCRPVSGVVAPADYDLTNYRLAPDIEESQVINLAIKACLAQPQRPAEIGVIVGLDQGQVRHYLKSMMRAGQIVRIGYALYGLPDTPMPTALVGRSVRTQPVRDAILAFLVEPRRTCEIATHIIRPIATATGHLAAMKRIGLIVQTERGVYVRTNRDRAELKQRQLRIAA